MKAAIIENFGELDKLRLAEVPTPTPADNEVQVRIMYSAVNPVDWKISQGLLKNRLEHQFPLILGWDAAGIITQVGKSVKNFKIGDEIFAYCRKPIVKWGTFAEYICLEAQHIALKPDSLSFAEAAAIPLTGLTAWQSLFDFAKLKKDDWVFIQAGSGGVGGMGIQFAKYAEAKVITTASKKNHAYVLELGADEVIDYEKENIAERVKEICPKGVDVVFDTLGGKNLKDSYLYLKPEGRLVSIVEPIDEGLANKYNVHAGYVFVSPNGLELKKIAELLDAGNIVTPEIHEYRLDEVKEALEQSHSGHTRGKIVIRVSEEEFS